MGALAVDKQGEVEPEEHGLMIRWGQRSQVAVKNGFLIHMCLLLSSK